MGIQVKELTRNLMPWGKEFIDFSFAGRHISEFGMVAVSSGDRYSLKGSPEFQDETTTVNGVNGQYYWGTNFKTKTYNYSLATDGMTERQFEDFKRHFRPGRYGQFYDDTWFDRYSYVRIKSVIDFSFIPFQEEVEVAGNKIKSRIYKGECKISFIQDIPYTYSFYQILDSKLSELSKKQGDNKEAALRMMYNNNIPALDSWSKDKKCSTGSHTSLPSSNNIEDMSPLFTKTSSVFYYNPSTYKAETTLQFDIKRTVTPINLIEWEPVYFNEIYSDITNSYIPYNTITTTNAIPIQNYNSNYDAIFQDNSRIFKYSLPEVSSDINKAIEVAWNFYQENVRGALVDLQNKLQEELINSKVLLWAIKVLQKIQVNQVMYCPINQESLLVEDGIFIDYDLTEYEQQPIQDITEEVIGEIIFHSGDFEHEIYDESLDIRGCLRPNKLTVYPYPVYNKEIEVDWFGYFNIMMLMMFADCSLYEQNDITVKDTFGNFYPYRLTFNGEKGAAFVSYKYNYMGGDGVIIQGNILDENCSNIVASNYLEIDGGDRLDISTGKISSYHILNFNHGQDKPMIVDNIKLEYKYTYV